MLRDRLIKLMADWGSHPAAPVVYEEMDDEHYEGEDIILTIVGVFAAFWIGQFIHIFLVSML